MEEFFNDEALSEILKRDKSIITEIILLEDKYDFLVGQPLEKLLNLDKKIDAFLKELSVKDAELANFKGNVLQGVIVKKQRDEEINARLKDPEVKRKHAENFEKVGKNISEKYDTKWLNDKAMASRNQGKEEYEKFLKEKNRLKEEIALLEQKRDDLLGEFEFFETEIQKEEKLVNQLKDEVKANQQKISEYKNNLEDLQKNVKSKNEKFAEISEAHPMDILEESSDVPAAPPMAPPMVPPLYVSNKVVSSSASIKPKTATPANAKQDNKPTVSQDDLKGIQLKSPGIRKNVPLNNNFSKKLSDEEQQEKDIKVLTDKKAAVIEKIKKYLKNLQEAANNLQGLKSQQAVLTEAKRIQNVDLNNYKIQVDRLNELAGKNNLSENVRAVDERKIEDENIVPVSMSDIPPPPPGPAPKAYDYKKQPLEGIKSKAEKRDVENSKEIPQLKDDKSKAAFDEQLKKMTQKRLRITYKNEMDDIFKKKTSIFLQALTNMLKDEKYESFDKLAPDLQDQLIVELERQKTIQNQKEEEEAILLAKEENRPNAEAKAEEIKAKNAAIEKMIERSVTFPSPKDIASSLSLDAKPINALKKEKGYISSLEQEYNELIDLALNNLVDNKSKQAVSEENSEMPDVVGLDEEIE